MEATGHKFLDRPQQGTIVYTRKVISFEPKQGKRARMSDGYINYRATKEAVDQYEKSPFRAIEKGVFWGIPAALSIIAGAQENSLPVADKAKTTLHAAKHIGILLGSFAIINKAANAVINRIPPLRRFKEDHPVVTGTGVFAGSAVGGLCAAGPLDKYVKDVAGKGMGKKIKESIVNQIKKSPLNKEGFKNFIDKYVFKPAEKHFGGEKGLNKFIWGSVAVIGGLMVKDIYDASQARKKQRMVKQQLELQRLKSQFAVLQNTSVERAEIKFVPSDKG